jgi:GNAT superfamily N-acetyltransferase
MKTCRLADFPQHADEVTSWVINEWPQPEVTFAARRNRLLGRTDCPATLLAVSDERPVGVLGFGRFRREGDDHLSLFIDVLYVHAADRRCGIGTALLRDAAGSAALFERELFVYTASLEWYQHRGWVVRQSGPDANLSVLSRELSRTA